MKELKTVCPWCETEIIWDEEVGPEQYCPYCDNELSNYRTIEIDGSYLDGEDDEDDEEAHHNHDDHDHNDDWEEDSSILRSTREIAANSQIQRLLDEQFEMPECTNCREYMIEVGEQTISGKDQFVPVKVPNSTKLLIPETMKVVWYVCPSCYRTDSYLSVQDRKHMLDALAEENE